MTETIIVFVVAAVIAAGVFYCLCWNSGDISEQEREDDNA